MSFLGIETLGGARMIELLNEADPRMSEIRTAQAFVDLINRCIATIEDEVGQQVNRGTLITLVMQWWDSIGRDSIDARMIELLDEIDARMIELLDEMGLRVSEVKILADFDDFVKRCIASEDEVGQQVHRDPMTFLVMQWRDSTFLAMQWRDSIGGGIRLEGRTNDPNKGKAGHSQ